MKEMEYLTSKDLEYFKRLEKKGQAVILELDPEALLSFDPQQFSLPETEPSYDEIVAFLREHELLDHKKKDSTPQEAQTEGNDLQSSAANSKTKAVQTKEIQTKTAAATVIDQLLTLHLSEEQWTLAEQLLEDNAITHEFSESQLLAFLQPDLSETKLKLIRKLVEREKGNT